MQNVPDLLARLGGLTLEPLWIPVLVWTALSLPVYVVLSRWHGGHPLLKYQAFLALLLALPAGILLAPHIDVALLPRWTGYERTMLAGKAEAVTPLLQASGQASGAAAGMTSLFVALGALTLAGGVLAVCRLVRLLGHGWALYRFRRALPSAFTPDLAMSVADLAHVLGIRRPVRVRATDAAHVPMTFGLFRPMIVLPASLLTHPAEVLMALRHELVHIRRFDAARQWIEHVLGAAFALHPLVALLRRRIRYYREVTCDLEVLSEHTIKPRDYALLLFRFVSPPNRKAALSLGMADTHKQLTRRIAAMKSDHFTLTPRWKTASILTAIALLSTTTAIVACTDLVGPDEPATQQAPTEEFVKVEQMPELEGGIASILQNLRYPAIAKKAGIEGRVIVQFVVDEQGRVVDPVVLRGKGAGLDEAALDAVQQSKWKPGRQGGVPVRVKMSIPITFKLGEDAASAALEPAHDRAGIKFVDFERTADRITGRLLSAETGLPLVGASIVLEGSPTIGAATDGDGRFVLRVSSTDSVVLAVGDVRIQVAEASSSQTGSTDLGAWRPGDGTEERYGHASLITPLYALTSAPLTQINVQVTDGDTRLTEGVDYRIDDAGLVKIINPALLVPGKEIHITYDQTC